MRKEIEIRVPPESVRDDEYHLQALARKLLVSPKEITTFTLTRRSIDARSRSVYYLLKFMVTVGEQIETDSEFSLHLQDVRNKAPVIIVGSGPAGMFAALRLIELGIKPVIFERGKSVRKRRRDLAAINKQGIVNPDSNYCFGEGGAGTFSDGKLFTRSNKRGSIERILNIFVSHGASRDILVEAHPHIGTNKLPEVVENIRTTILECGGEIHFDSRVVDLLINSAGVQGIVLVNGEKHFAKSVILATGHSARDIFYLLQSKDLLLESKPFAMGVRVEHPQSLINQIQYRSKALSPYLPPASYSLVAQCEGRGVFSFCMCPGGIICPAATSGDQVVVNGWSPSKRDSYFANSGIVVEIKARDLLPFSSARELAGVKLQQELEEKSFLTGGGSQVAPAQRLTDFIDKKVSTTLPKCSYIPGVQSSDLQEIFPTQLCRRLIQAFKEFEIKRNGYISEEALVVAVESRTSSPVRIPRDQTTMMHPEVPGLFPIGEGAGYAGGIVSAAMDGEASAKATSQFLRVNSLLC